ncbi:class I SAM-dependent methyltransferase [Mesorhizobium sp. BAC0120]|uniref:class I SAM-dependent methyltransferase n=1 Tax=Mesorhizobium sp. BAC0120 TaxID=3090670 RepID=UPI00298C0548|nr:class I SAM-dependent methyltransferase [Mesorhizobium sp. BAC0120]MDW6020968.1 class I SAM-dependent methyltransferase [Mesorhizobium sp. BAC0120]
MSQHDSAETSQRYEFGANWKNFIDKHYSKERLDQAQMALLKFLDMQDLSGLTFLDIGCGSGLHSLAALQANARRIHSFDFDKNSVETTLKLQGLAKSPSHWTVEWGDVLDSGYMGNLGLWDIVYSWGVLHHTGSMWQAIDNAAQRVANNGLFFIALYSSNVATPSPEFWLDVKRRYNAADAKSRRRMEYWYLWRFGLRRNPLRLPLLLKQIYDKKKQRGMSYMTDVKDWLGGWPMEYADDQQVVDRLEEKHRFKLAKISTGEACTEFLFRNVAIEGRKTKISEFVARQRSTVSQE